MLFLGVTTPASVPQRSAIPEGFTNYPVYVCVYVYIYIYIYIYIYFFFFKLFSAFFLIAVLSPEIATSITIHVRLFIITDYDVMMPGLLLGMVLSAGTC